MNSELDLDRVLQVVSARYRRWILYLLLDKNASTLDMLVSDLQSICEAVDGDGIDGEHVLIRLYHSDIPKLVEANVVEYDHRNGDLVLTDEATELRGLLTMIKEWEDPAVRTAIQSDN